MKRALKLSCQGSSKILWDDRRQTDMSDPLDYWVTVSLSVSAALLSARIKGVWHMVNAQ